MQINPLTPVIGAELSGLDLAADLEDAAVAGIHAALMKHLVVFIRDQSLTPRRQAAFAARFLPARAIES